MRMLLKAQLDVEKGNEAVSTGGIQQALGSVMEQLRPEAAYFTVEDGRRTALIFFDMEDPSQMPVVAEPFFIAANASVDVTPVMTADELQAGLQRVFGSQGSPG